MQPHGWQCAPAGILVQVFELLLDPPDATRRLGIVQIAAQRLALASVCRWWRQVVTQALVSVADRAITSPSVLLWATGMRLREADLGINMLHMPERGWCVSYALGRLPVTLRRLSLTLQYHPVAGPVTWVGVSVVLPQAVRLRSLHIYNAAAVLGLTYVEDLFRAAERVELAGSGTLVIGMPGGTTAASFPGQMAAALLASPCRQLVVHNPTRVVCSPSLGLWEPQGPLAVWRLTDQYAEAICLAAPGGALDGVLFQTPSHTQDTMWRVVRTADLPPPHRHALLDVGGCSSVEQLAAVVQARGQAEVVNFSSGGGDTSTPAGALDRNMFERRQALLQHPLFHSNNRSCLRRVQGLFTGASSMDWGLGHYPLLTEVAVVAEYSFSLPPILPPTITRLELSWSTRFNAEVCSHLTQLKELAVTGHADKTVYDNLSALPPSITSLELSLPGLAHLQRLRVPQLVLTQAGCWGAHPLVAHLQHWQSAPRRLVLRHAAITLCFPGRSLADLAACLARCKWLKALRFELLVGQEAKAAPCAGGEQEGTSDSGSSGGGAGTGTGHPAAGSSGSSSHHGAVAGAAAAAVEGGGSASQCEGGSGMAASAAQHVSWHQHLMLVAVPPVGGGSARASPPCALMELLGQEPHAGCWEWEVGSIAPGQGGPSGTWWELHRRSS